MKMKSLLYIGNKLSSQGLNKTTIDTLGISLEKEGYKIIYTSSKKKQFLRFIDMVFTTIITARKVDFILIDTYSTSSFWYAFTCSQIARAFQAQYIPILHGGNLPNRLKNNPWLSKMIFQNAYKNIAPSNYLKNEFEKVGFKNILHIPNTVELDKYTFKNRKVLEPKLLWVRAFASIYNPMMAIYVLKKLQSEFPKATLTMVGPDKDGSLLKAEELAKELGVTVNFTGRLTKEEWCRQAIEHGIFINTTHFDNTPISVMEAMALGLPVVSTNVGGLSYLLEHEKDAILVNDNDVNQMVIEISALILTPEKVRKITSSARLKVEKMDWSVVKIKWDALFLKE
jgi:L-malate glycosyltransferase